MFPKRNPDGLGSRARDVREDLASSPSRLRSTQREPPPVLFLHPSPSTSHVSLPGIMAPGAPVPGPASSRRERLALERSASVRSSSAAPGDAQTHSGRVMHPSLSNRSNDRTDALWAEMQATLEEVELSASGGTHVFGPEHGGKLAELRNAQIALAQAWARSEADDGIEATLDGGQVATAGDELRSIKGTAANVQRAGAGDGAEQTRSTTGTASVRPESSIGGADRLGARLDEETEADILLARKRRETNDQYFQRVNNGVMDVVAKLEGVAVAMRAVEQESKDVWREVADMSGSEGA